MHNSITLTQEKNNISFVTTILLSMAAFFLSISTSICAILILLSVLINIFSTNYWQAVKEFSQTPLAIATIAFVLIYGLRVMFSYADFNDALYGFKKIAKYSYIILLIPLFWQEKTKKSVLIGFLLGMLLTLILGAMKFYFGFNIGMKYSAAAVFKSHIQTNFLMAIAAFILAHMAFDNKKYKGVFIALAILSSYYVWFMSVGRSGYLVYLSLTLVFCWQRYNIKGLIIGPLVSMLLIFSAYNFADDFKTRINDISSDYAKYEQGDAFTSTGQRLGFAKNSLKLIKEKPILGFGTGSFAKAYSDIANPTQALKTTNPHNEYLHVWVELGLLGLVIMLVWFATIFKQSFKLEQSNKFLATGVIVSFASGCLINSWLLDTTEGYFLVLFVALCFAVKPGENKC